MTMKAERPTAREVAHRICREDQPRYPRNFWCNWSTSAHSEACDRLTAAIEADRIASAAALSDAQGEARELEVAAADIEQERRMLAAETDRLKGEVAIYRQNDADQFAAIRASLETATELLRHIEYYSPAWHDRRTDFLRDHRGFATFHDFHAELAAARRLVGDWMRSHPHDPLSAASARAVTGARFEYPEALIQPSKEAERG